MSRVWPWLAAGLLFWVAAVLQQSLSPRLTIWGGAPEFLILVALCFALISRPAGGAICGFLSGVIAGGLTGATLTHFVVTRTVTGFGFSFLGQSGIEVTSRKAGLIVAVGTLVTQILFMLVAPPSGIGLFLRATLVTAMYNGVLAIPLYGLLHRLFRPKVV